MAESRTTKAAKKPRSEMEFTSHTLWTARCQKAQGGSFQGQITRQVQEQFEKTLAASQDDLKQKLETFEPLEALDAAARCLIR
jgi:hypothetical protein